VPEVAKEVGAFTTWKEKLDKPIATIPWVVDSLLVAGSSTLVYGEGGLGKSWFAAHVAGCVLTGEPVHGEFEVHRKGNVLWYDNENGEDENDRRTQKMPPKGFEGCEYDVYMRETPKYHFKGNSEGLRQMQEDIQEVKPVLCVVDSMISTLEGDMDENSAKDVRALIDGIMATVADVESPPAFLFIHHAKKAADGSDDWPGFRGSSDFQNAVGFLVAMRGRGDKVQFKWMKSRRGKMPKETYEYALLDRVEQNMQNILLSKTFVDYVPSAKPLALRDEVELITKDVIKEHGPLALSKLITFVSEQFSKPPSKPFLTNLFYKFTKDGTLKRVINKTSTTYYLS